MANDVGFFLTFISLLFIAKLWKLQRSLVFFLIPKSCNAKGLDKFFLKPCVKRHYMFKYGSTLKLKICSRKNVQETCVTLLS